MLEKDSDVKHSGMILCGKFEQWEKAVTTFQYDFIGLADTSH
ncbi:MAG: hypothetical protein M0036_03495 [Desulfobacteraceae bacterium]|nr:hypothetical protein [Desulfobacteraceae bacterium]